MKSKGVYTALLDCVRGMKVDGEIMLDANDVKNAVKSKVDASDFDKEELLDAYISFLAAIVLNQENCYSLERRTGKYVNLDACTNADSIIAILGNKESDIGADMKIWDAIKQHLLKIKETSTPGQYCMDYNDPTSIYAEESIEDMLRRVAANL